MMRDERLLHTMADEMDGIIRQLQSPDPVHRAAGLMRLMDFSKMLTPHRGRVLTRREVMRIAGTTFAALALKPDD